jgi:hypothetical protein
MEVESMTPNMETGNALAELTAAAVRLERAAAAIETRLTAGGEVAKMVATVETDPAVRLNELEMKLQLAEQKIAELRAQTAAPTFSGRKTLPAATTHLLAKHGLDTLEQVNAGALDAALTGLSLEQRVAVKSQLMRAGLLG